MGNIPRRVMIGSAKRLSAKQAGIATPDAVLEQETENQELKYHRQSALDAVPGHICLQPGCQFYFASDEQQDLCLQKIKCT